MVDFAREVRRCLGGAVGASRQARWEDLYRTHAGHVHAFACRRVGRQDAADVVDETFLVAWRRIDQVPERSLPWLYAVARNVIGNVRKAARRREALHERIRSSRIGENLTDPTGDVDARRDILDAIKRLPPAERDALTLIACDELDARSAASVIGCSPGAFAARIHRGRRHLRGLLVAGAYERRDLRAGLDQRRVS